MRVGIDYGSKRIGLAKSILKVVLPIPHIERKSDEGIITNIIKIFEKEDIEEFVIGFPIHLNGKEGEMCQKVREFANKFQKRGHQIVLFDERLTSREAMSILSYKSNQERRLLANSISASIILESYISKLSSREKEDK